MDVKTKLTKGTHSKIVDYFDKEQSKKYVFILDKDNKQILMRHKRGDKIQNEK